jgi:UPF0755 protein
MAERKRKRFGCFGCLLWLAAAGLALILFVQWALRPTPPGEKRYIRLESPMKLDAALVRLEKEGFVSRSWAVRGYAVLTGNGAPVKRGTYEFAPGMSASEVLRALRKPVRQMVRLPETNWAARSANLLEKAQVCTAEEYMALVRRPNEFRGGLPFELPAGIETLEGYLYPDTYDLPPLLGARGVVERQLANFYRKVLEGKPRPKDLHRTIIVASMVELEVARDEERPIVAGVIENRIMKNMRLQIDASLLYGIQEWRRLTYDDYRNIPGPYNLYRHGGLPPGPICSPTVESIEAALNPAEHDYLYYVALPEGRHLFSKTYGEHLRNIQKRRAALRQREKEKEAAAQGNARE